MARPDELDHLQRLLRRLQDADLDVGASHPANRPARITPPTGPMLQPARALTPVVAELRRASITTSPPRRWLTSLSATSLVTIVVTILVSTVTSIVVASLTVPVQNAETGSEVESKATAITAHAYHQAPTGAALALPSHPVSRAQPAAAEVETAAVEAPAVQVAIVQAAPPPEPVVLPQPYATLKVPAVLVAARGTRTALPFITLGDATLPPHDLVIEGLEPGATIRFGREVTAGSWLIEVRDLKEARLERGGSAAPRQNLSIELRAEDGTVLARRHLVLLLDRDSEAGLAATQ